MEKGANRAPVQSTSNNAGEIRDVSATENVFTQEEIVKKPLAISSGQADAFVDTLNLPLDPIVERSFRRKCDLYIVPLLTLSFIFAFIDRANLGNAKVVGLEKDLNMKGLDFNWASTAFYFTYIVVEVPSNIILKKVGARIWLSCLCFIFGLITLCTTFIHSYGSLITMRLLLGLAEGGLFPGYAFYLSSFYPRYEVVTRISIVGSSAYTSGFIGPFLALGFEHLPDFGPIHTWRHIYLFEGIISMVLGTVSFIILPTDIETAWFLKPAEKQVGLERLRRQMLEETVPGVRMKDIKAATMNIGNWIASILYMAINVPTQACIIFLPSIIKAMGYRAGAAQIMSGAPFLLAAIVVIFQGWLSDRIKRRGLVMLCFVPFMVLCFMLLLIFTLSGPALLKISGLRYMALFLGVGFGSTGVPLTLAWAGNNSPVPAVRAVSTAMVVGVGGLGSFISSWTYTNAQAPLFIVGHSINLAFSIVAVSATASYYLYATWENKQRNLGRRDDRLVGLSEDEANQLGHRHPHFRYAS
ncbi:uncharacterized protein PV06_04406 [Exophiala oligosperma]|uniref:Major facilitator superfamily (MFS) profile domain-containing protein n=1 Tax=Exophiala oligosperma TaxID=215243 RepID=A0A0D2DJY5_9EURO|nr:uncharacterized protein PV06_04406 [Exophiala oligosperma]KIW43288.1 hypothetical protein PV06_04406 [Exophiala oligosperma]